MIDLHINPSKNELRWFGLLFAGFFGLLGFMIWRQFDALHVAKVLWIVGPAIGLFYYLVPPLQKAIYVGWVRLTYPIGWVVSHLLLGITFFVVLTPIGLLVRLLRGDPMARRLDRGAATYWITRKPVTDSTRYFKQF